jgi:hypothetical protein
VNLRFERAVGRRLVAERAAGSAAVAQVTNDCPGVDGGLPVRRGHPTARSQESLLFVSEVTDAVYIDEFKPLLAVARQTAAVESRLRFSDPAITYSVRSAAPSRPALLELQPPDLCADARELADSDFQRLTPTGRRFLLGATIIGGAADPIALLRTMRA